MPPIVLTSLNARYHHCALSLRCIQANLGELRPKSLIQEFVIKQSTEDVAEALLAHDPQILLISVYIWNVEATLKLLHELRKRSPELKLVVGGPEVSYPPLYPGITEAVDYVVTGEGEIAARELCEQLLSGNPPKAKFIKGPQEDVETTVLPYDLYTDDDIKNRIVYLETSRGCPYRCEYCLSSLDREVRFFPLDELLAAFQILMDRGVRLFKLLDRTFNTKIDRAVRILEFFLDNLQSGLVIHCEVVPDRIPDELKACFQRFPAGCLQFEVGVQSFNQEVLDRIRRAQKADKVEKNLAWLCNESKAVIHADLIFGLPGETLESMQDSFNRLVIHEPDQIQLNLLKLLKGTPIVQHTEPFGMVYAPKAPFEIQETSTIDRDTMQMLREFSRVWTLFHNAEKLKTSLPYVWRDQPDAFAAYLEFTNYIKANTEKLYGIDFLEQVRLLDDWLQQHSAHPARARQAIIADYSNWGKRILPKFLRVS